MLTLAVRSRFLPVGRSTINQQENNVNFKLRLAKPTVKHTGCGTCLLSIEKNTNQD